MLDCACRIPAAYAHTLHHLCIAIDRYVLLLLFLTRFFVMENNFQIFLVENQNAYTELLFCFVVE